MVVVFLRYTVDIKTTLLQGLMLWEIKVRGLDL
jgi:hypothetical protein